MGKLTWDKDATLGVVSGVLGIGYLVGALQITPDPSQFNVLGPRVAPVTIGIATVLCSVALLVQGLRTRPESAAESSESTSPESPESSAGGLPAVDEPEQDRSLGRLLVMFGLFAAYILVFIPLGYLLSTFAFLVAMTTYVDRRRWIRNCVFAAAFAGIVYLLFTRALRVDLPTGLFG